MKLMCQLNSLSYISDYKEIGLEGIMVGNDEISSRHALHLSFEEMEALTKDFTVFIMMNLLYSEQELPLVKDWLLKIKNSHIHGIVFQDFGLWMMAKELGLTCEMMYAPETLNTNHLTLNDLHQLGFDSAFLAREIYK